MSIEKLNELSKMQRKLESERNGLLDSMLNSNDPVVIMKAQQQLGAIQPKEKLEKKAYLLDPYDFQSSFGYKNRPTQMSYTLLRNMAKTPIINAIIRTRINQVASFAEPQRDKYSMGFVIRKKRKFDLGEELTKQEQNEIEFLTEFMLNCGENSSFDGDDFDAFLRKITRDSLTFDQLTFEVVRKRNGEISNFFATDSSTIRIADSYDDELYADSKYNHPEKRKPIFGYYPNFVQILQGQTYAEFYPWEMCFGIRNPSTDVDLNGYGISELEEMIATVTSMLWGDEYNRNFFRQGSAPKGMLKVDGGFGDHRLQEFRQQWNATMRGVWNAWRTPIIESGKVEWVDLQKSNRDMEFSNWVEYLIKIACAIYAIDPAEVNFPLSGGSAQQSLFEGSNEQRLKHSKDKGLYPLLKFIRQRLNKYIVNHFFDGKYELAFVGLDAISAKEEQDMDISALSNYETINEVRARRGLEPIENGDIVLNPTFMQNLQMQQQASMFGGEEGEEDEEDDDEGGFTFSAGEDEEFEQAYTNPFETALNTYLKKL